MEWKRSSKGVQHSVELTYEDFCSVIYTGVNKVVPTHSIRLHQNEMKTMVSTKVGLRNLHIKNYVQEDRISTRPFTRNATMIQ